MTQLNQINVSYNVAEDRMLLRMTAQASEGMAEFRLWLTRRFVRLMWKAMEQVLDRDTAKNPAVMPDSRQALRQFEEEAALSSADFETPYTAGEQVVAPLGEEPVLVTRLQIRAAEGDRKFFQLSGAEGRGITLTLAPAMIHSLRKLLADVAARAEWNLELTPVGTPAVAEAPQADSRTLN